MQMAQTVGSLFGRIKASNRGENVESSCSEGNNQSCDSNLTNIIDDSQNTTITSDVLNRITQDWTMPKYKQFPNSRVEYRAKVAFAESMYIAWRAHEALDDNNAVFERYFKPSDKPFVREAFKGLLEPDTWGPSPVFSRLTIYYGSRKGIGLDFCARAPNLLAYLATFDNEPGREADLIICPSTMSLPTTQDKYCTSLSNHVDFTFLVLGSVMIHEYMHWPDLTREALKLKNPPPPKILDYRGPDPPSGYGPYNVLQVREKHDPTANADNFNWFSIEAYWHKTCRPARGQYGPGIKDDPTCGLLGRPELRPHCYPD